jgi:hypothetical protein
MRSSIQDVGLKWIDGQIINIKLLEPRILFDPALTTVRALEYSSTPNVPPLRVPAYKIVGVFGSTARVYTIASSFRPEPVGCQLWPALLVLKTPLR